MLVVGRLDIKVSGDKMTDFQDIWLWTLISFAFGLGLGLAMGFLI